MSNQLQKTADADTTSSQSVTQKKLAHTSKVAKKPPARLQRQGVLGDERSLFGNEVHAALEDSRDENRSLFETDPVSDEIIDPIAKLKKRLLKKLRKNFKKIVRRIKQKYQDAEQLKKELADTQDAYEGSVYFIEDIFKRYKSYQEIIQRLEQVGYLTRNSKSSLGQQTGLRNQNLPSDYTTSQVTRSPVRTRVRHQEPTLKEHNETVRLDEAGKNHQETESSQNAVIHGTGTEVKVIIQVKKNSDPIRTEVRIGKYDKFDSPMGDRPLYFENGDTFVKVAPGQKVTRIITGEQLRHVRELSVYTKSTLPQHGNKYTIDLVIKSKKMHTSDQVIIDIQEDKKK